MAGISGSLRAGSYNTMLLKAAAGLAPEGMKIEIVPISEIPLYNGDYDLPIATSRPESVERFRAVLAAADGILLVTPEYNHSVPGVLKNAMDWASRGTDSPLSGKPVAMMGASSGSAGTSRAQAAWLPLFQIMNMKYSPQPEVLVSKAQDKFDGEGSLTDEVVRKIISRNLQALRETILRNR